MVSVRDRVRDALRTLESKLECAVTLPPIRVKEGKEGYCATDGCLYVMHEAELPDVPEELRTFYIGRAVSHYILFKINQTLVDAIEQEALTAADPLLAMVLCTVSAYGGLLLVEERLGQEKAFQLGRSFVASALRYQRRKARDPLSEITHLSSSEGFLWYDLGRKTNHEWFPKIACVKTEQEYRDILKQAGIASILLET